MMMCDEYLDHFSSVVSFDETAAFTKELWANLVRLSCRDFESHRAF